MLCPRCNYSAKGSNALRVHASKSHSMSSEELYLTIQLDNIRPACKCGCGEHTKFNSFQRGYSDYAWGHVSRVKNNWGHNAAAKGNSLKKRRQEGLWSKTPWNRGKRKESDPRIARAADTMHQKHGPRYSERMRQGRLNGTIQTLRGPHHPQWKGGTSILGSMCHADNQLYLQWKLPKLQAASFACSRCSSTESLHVHHDSIRMAEIIAVFRCQLPPGDLTHEQKLLVVRQVVDYHIEKHITGIVLCEKCHIVEHSHTC